MARAVGDPDSIKQLARRLRQASNEMDKIAQGLLSAFKGTDWNDQVQKRFEQDLNQLVKSVRAFKTQADSAERHLEQKARDLEVYLRHN